MIEENELPEGWTETTLGDITAPIRISVLPGEYPTLPFVGMEHVEAETMKLLGTIPASELKSSAVRFWPGDVLYGRLRPYLNKILRPDFEGLCSGEFLVFREFPHLNSRYLQYFLNSWSFKEFASHLNEGDRPRVDWSQLKIFKFPLPPLPEQQRIVAAIEQQFTRLDAGVAALKRVQTKLKRYRAAVLKAAVEGKLTEAWGAEHPMTEPASALLERILAERRAKWEADLRAKGKDPARMKYVEPAEPDVESLPELPEGWCWANLDELSRHVTSGSRGWAQYYADSGSLFVRVGNFNRLDTKIDLQNVVFVRVSNSPEANRCRLQIGDLLITITADVGMVGVVDERVLQWGEAFINQHVGLVRLIHPELTAFIALALASEPTQIQVRAKQYGATKIGLGLEDLRSLIIPLAPPDEQQQIVAEVERRLSVISQLEATVEANLKRAERLRQSILKEAFTGRLVSQDPTDEPASVLLERICKEREERKQGMVNKGRVVQVEDVVPMQIDVRETEQGELWESVGGGE